MKTMDNKPENKKSLNKIKIAYAFAFVLAIGGIFIAKYSTEKSLGNISVPIESDYAEIKVTLEPTTSRLFTYDEGEQVRQNVTNVPDTRQQVTEKNKETKQETEKQATTEKDKHAEPYEDFYSLPMGTDILKDYSDGKLVLSKTMNDWRVHNAVDFKADEGEQVKSIAYGTVVEIYDDVLYGTVVVIDHGNGVTAKYCGLNSQTLEVKKGRTVDTGSLIGYLGTVPCEKADGYHLHFEVIYKDKTVDPLELMGR